jgi:hypothetical protein
MGGWHSGSSAEELIGFLFLDNIVLTSKDLVIIDHSVNDALSFPSRGSREQQIFQNGIELLIRNILLIAKSRPTIIMIELHPRTALYSPVYHSLTKHYNITLLSLLHYQVRDVTSAGQSQLFYDHMNFKYVRVGTGHPAWHIHLLVADHVGALILHQFALVQSHAHIQVNEGVPSLLVPRIEPACVAEPFPVFITPAQQFNFSDRKVKDYYVIAGNGLQSSALWKVGEDVMGKPGIFIQSNIRSSPPILPIKNTALTFVLNNLKTMVTSHSHSHSSYRLGVMYLRSYFNAGILELFLCGKPLGTLDAMWPSWFNLNISLPVSKYFLVDGSLSKACQKSSTVTLSTSYSFIPALAENPARDNQKFKILSVRLCRV